MDINNMAAQLQLYTWVKLKVGIVLIQCVCCLFFPQLPLLLDLRFWTSLTMRLELDWSWKLTSKGYCSALIGLNILTLTGDHLDNVLDTGLTDTLTPHLVNIILDTETGLTNTH